MSTLGENFNVVVSPTPKDMSEAAQNWARKIIAQAFMQLWEAAHLYNDTDGLADEPSNQSITETLDRRAAFIGGAVQLAQTLACRGDDIVRRSPQFDIEDNQKSTQGLIDILQDHWLPRLPMIDMTPEAWNIFFEAVELQQAGRASKEHNVRLTKLAPLPKGTWDERVAYYINDVVPEYRRWHKGLGNFELPRI